MRGPILFNLVRGRQRGGQRKEKKGLEIGLHVRQMGKEEWDHKTFSKLSHCHLPLPTPVFVPPILLHLC